MSKNIFDSILNPNMVDFALIEVDDNGNEIRVMPDEYITRHNGATWTLYSFDILKGTVKNRKVCFSYGKYVPADFASKCAAEWYRAQRAQAENIYLNAMQQVNEVILSRGEQVGLCDDEQAVVDALTKRYETLKSALAHYTAPATSAAVANLIRAEMGRKPIEYPTATANAYKVLASVLKPCMTYGFHAGDSAQSIKQVKAALQALVDTLWDESDMSHYHWTVNSTMAHAVISFLYGGEGHDANGKHVCKWVNLESGKVISMVVLTLYHALQDKAFDAIKVELAKKPKPDDVPTLPISGNK